MFIFSSDSLRYVHSAGISAREALSLIRLTVASNIMHANCHPENKSHLCSNKTQRTFSKVVVFEDLERISGRRQQ